MKGTLEEEECAYSFVEIIDVGVKEIDVRVTIINVGINNIEEYAHPRGMRIR